MITPSLGIVEVLLISLITLLCGLALPIGVIYFLFVINKKLNAILEILMKNKQA